MIVTDAGLNAMETTSRGPLSRVMGWFGFSPRSAMAPFSSATIPPVVDSLRLYHAPAPAVPIDAAKLAERYAFNALVSAGNGRYQDAESFFREAFTLNRKLKPETLTNFWQLPRQAQDAAIRALIAAGRDDEAVLLAREIDDRSVELAQAS